MPIDKVKRRLSPGEEFEIMKLVLDKFLWLGTALMGWGLYKSIVTTFAEGVWFILAGALVMAAFSWIIVREFEKIR